MLPTQLRFFPAHLYRGSLMQLILPRACSQDQDHHHHQFHLSRNKLGPTSRTTCPSRGGRLLLPLQASGSQGSRQAFLKTSHNPSDSDNVDIFMLPDTLQDSPLLCSV